jgi:HK97 family phage major capsid protein
MDKLVLIEADGLLFRGLAADHPLEICDYPVAIDENMPDIGANAFPIAFGNWKLGYRIVDRFRTRLIRDPFTDKPNVHF